MTQTELDNLSLRINAAIEHSNMPKCHSLRSNPVQPTCRYPYGGCNGCARQSPTANPTCYPPEQPKYDPHWTSEERQGELLRAINGDRFGGGCISLTLMPGGYRTAKLKGRNGIEVSCEVRGTINPDVMQEIRCNLLNKFFEEVSRREGYDRHMALVEAQKDKERRSKRWANWFWWLK